MTKQEILSMISKLEEMAASAPDGDIPADSPTVQGDPPTDEKGGDNKPNTDNPPADKSDPPADENTETRETNSNDEVEEEKQIEPQTNGKVTDDITPKVDTQFEQSTDATETEGVEQVLSASLDQRFATVMTNYAELKAEMDKMKVALSEILTRIELVQEVTDKVTTVDHDSLLSESIKLLI